MNPVKPGIRQDNFVVPAGVRLLVGTPFPLVGTNNPGIELQGNGTGSLYVTGAPFGAGYIGTEAAGTRCMVDLRSSQGTVRAPTHSLSGDELGGVQIGGGASPDGSLIDVGTMTCFAGADFSASSTPTQWSFRAVPSGSTGKVIVWTVDGSGTVTMTGALSGATNMVDLSTIPDTTHNVVSAFNGLWGTTMFAATNSLTLRRANGSAGNPTGISSGQDIGQVIPYGTFDTSGSFKQAATMKVTATETWGSTAAGSKISFSVVANTTTAQATALTLDQDQSATFTNAVLSSSATAGVGYKTGAGGAVTQLTSKSTAFPTISKVCGTLTWNNAALAASTNVTAASSTNTAIAATDTVIFNHVSGGTLGSYTMTCTPSAGTWTLTLRNVSTGSLSEAPVFNYAIIKAVTS